ncbi:transmembrane 4 L6 family member 19 [Leptodactylus fuscus]|uniref:transmembrane 4 L6 family member 19 n=1 Tax=Leptodactylus fuscus TaxID=238119 RepID=UPI003F4ED473
MCVGKCARCTGLSLMLLAMFSIAANLFLIFPNLDGSYLKRQQISRYATSMSGVWAGGLMMLLSGISSLVALLGAAISLSISVTGLFNGPYCLFQVDDGGAQKWGYLKFKPLKNSSAILFLETSSWSSDCIEPPHIEAWHSSFFILLSLCNILQISLCLSQMVNAFFGVLCGHCDQKKDQHSV